MKTFSKKTFHLHSLQAKFLSSLAIICLALSLVFISTFYVHMKDVIETEIQDKARLIFSHVDAVQNYIRTILRPIMYERVPDEFIIEAMSTSFVSRTIMSKVNEQGKNSDAETLYRRIAIGARNPQYEATEKELELIAYFRREPNEKTWEGYQNFPNGSYYITARPVVFEKSCMHCHGDPKKAPATIIEKYGMRGFHKKENEIYGIDLVGISVDGSVGHLQRTIFMYLVFFVLAAGAFFVTVNILFRVLVLNDLKRLIRVFRRNTADSKSTALLEKIEQGDEITELIDGMEQMGEHLYEARRKLQHYAENLRVMVDERTDALSREVTARRADVDLFVCLLSGMRQSHSRRELWRFALPQICHRFHARCIHFIGIASLQQGISWPENTNYSATECPAQCIEDDICYMDNARIFIPVQSSWHEAQGVICIEWENAAQASAQDISILHALGRQLGTVTENILAMDGVMRQMLVLQTIFEGITDPLMLMDESYKVLTVNSAARKLCLSLSKDENTNGNLLAVFFHAEEYQHLVKDMLQRGTAEVREVSLLNGQLFALALYPVQNSGEEQKHLVVFAREITTEKKMLEQVSRSEKLATVGKLTAGLAHEINNPLGVILCYTELLRQNIKDEQAQADIAVIERHTRQAQKVLRELLNFARPKAAGSGVSRIEEVTQSIAAVFSVQAQKKGAQISLHVADNLPAVGIGLNELEQIISNLVINALDAVPQSFGVVDISLKNSPSDNMVQFCIEDNGSGIAPADLTHIFDPFFSTKEPNAGTGLGLAVVHSMITDIGGSVEAGHSKKLGGALFAVHIPAVNKSESEVSKNSDK